MILYCDYFFIYYYKKAIYTSDLNQQISNEKFKDSISTIYSYNGIYKCLNNECNKGNINIYNKIFNSTRGDINK